MNSTLSLWLRTVIGFSVIVFLFACSSEVEPDEQEQDEGEVTVIGLSDAGPDEAADEQTADTPPEEDMSQPDVATDSDLAVDQAEDAPEVQDDIGESDTETDTSLDEHEADPDVSPPELTVGPVEATYENAQNWNDYVTSTTSITDVHAADCSPERVPLGYGQCRHGGESRRVHVSGAETCNGLDISDNLGAFFWLCQEDERGMWAISTRLRRDFGLVDLLDLSGETPALQAMSVTVSDGEREATTEATVWWDNDVRWVSAEQPELSNTRGDAVGTIFVVPAGNFAAGLVVVDNKVSVVRIAGGTTGRVSEGPTSALRANGLRNLWIEGDFEVSNLVNFGLALGNVSLSVFRRLRVSNSAVAGIWLYGSELGSHSNRLSQIALWAPKIGLGIGIQGVVRHNRFSDLYLANFNRGIDLSYCPSIGIECDSSESMANHFSRMTIAHSGDQGVVGRAMNVTFDTLTIVNGDEAVYTDDDSDGHIVVAATALNSDNTSGWVTAGSGILLSHLLVGGPYDDALDFEGTGGVVSIVRDVASASVGSYDLRLDGLTQLNGLVIANECNGDVFDSECTFEETSDSDAIIKEFLGFNLEMVLVVETDDTNLHGGRVARESLEDWVEFDSPFRGWGVSVDEGWRDDWPDYEHLGKCYSGECDIWDTRLWNTASHLRDVFRPSVEDVLVHTWAVDLPGSQADCDAAVDGTTYNEGACQTTYMNHAIEIADDGVGNDNSLCESNEACLTTPNYGSYQGHGPLELVTTLNGDEISNVRLYRFRFNGVAASTD